MLLRRIQFIADESLGIRARFLSTPHAFALIL